MTTPLLKWNAVFKNAIWQQGNGDISWDDFTIELSTDEEIADTGVLAFFYYKTEGIYFALEDHSEMSLTILDTEAHDSLGDDLNDFINIFFRTAEPSLDIEEANSIIQYLHHLEDDEAFDFLYSDNMSFEYSRFGYIPYSETHFTNDTYEDTHYYSAIPLSELPHEK